MEVLRHLSSGGVDIAYRRRAAAHPTGLPPLVLIHGAASNMTRWSAFSDRTGLGERHDLLRLDLRGHGASLYRGPVGLGIWCDDIAALLHHEGIERAILVGHCLGANIAALFAVRYPELTAGLVLVEPMPSKALKGPLKRVRPFAPVLQGAIAVIRFLNRFGLYRRRLQPLDLRALDEALRSHLGSPDEEAFLKQYYGSAWRDIKTLPTAVFLKDMLEILRPLPWQRIRAPMLALLSTGQGYVNPAATRALLASVADAEVVTIKAEHWIPAEQPQAMREAIEAWVGARDWRRK